MTLLELQDSLSNQIKKLESGMATKHDFEQAKQITLIAKQMINNADVVLRTDKFLNELKKNQTTNIEKLVK